MKLHPKVQEGLESTMQRELLEAIGGDLGQLAPEDRAWLFRTCQKMCQGIRTKLCHDRKVAAGLASPVRQDGSPRLFAGFEMAKRLHPSRFEGWGPDELSAHALAIGRWANYFHKVWRVTWDPTYAAEMGESRPLPQMR